MAEKEDYLQLLDTRIASKEAVLARLEERINDAKRRLNEANAEVSKVGREMDGVLIKQAEIVDRKLRKINDEAQQWQEANELYLEDLVKKDSELHLHEKILQEKLEDIEKRELVLSSEKDIISLELTKAGALLVDAIEKNNSASASSEEASSQRKEVSRHMREVEKKIKVWAAHEARERELIAEQKKELSAQLAAAKVERKRYFEAWNELINERKKIKSEWQLLMDTKKILDERRKSCHCRDGGEQP